MKKRIITVAFAAAILFSGAMLFQVENVDAQDATHTDATPVDEFPELGKWIPIYNGNLHPVREDCIAHSADECSVGDTRKPQLADVNPVGN